MEYCWSKARQTKLKSPSNRMEISKPTRSYNSWTKMEKFRKPDPNFNSRVNSREKFVQIRLFIYLTPNRLGVVQYERKRVIHRFILLQRSYAFGVQNLSRKPFICHAVFITFQVVWLIFPIKSWPTANYTRPIEKKS